jgi:tRNA (guanine10-N2)-dimethyltransferase
MDKFCFILGKNPLLSLAEIFSVANYYQADFQIIDLTSEILVTQTEELPADQWQSRLGGTIKICIIVKSFNKIDELAAYLSPDNLKGKLFNQHKKKIIFGFSLYGNKFINQKKKFNSIGLRIKKELQTSGYKSRFLEAPEGALSAVQIDKNKIIEAGADIIAASGIHALYLGKTLTVQDYEKYSQRDYGRPERDVKSGLLPPKLAKIMINLSGAGVNDQLLDPFCGSGTIIQEAILMGFKKIIGSDISQKAINDSKKNIDWLIKKYKLPADKIKLHPVDVKKLDKKIPSNSVDVIISEPYLGPPKQKNISVTDMLALIQELENLYLAAFNAFKKIVKSGGRIIIVFPLFKTKYGIFLLKILEQLEKMGFSRINPLPEKVSLFAKASPTARGSLIYQRPDQKVQREIFIFQRQK